MATGRRRGEYGTISADPSPFGRRGPARQEMTQSVRPCRGRLLCPRSIRPRSIRTPLIAALVAVSFVMAPSARAATDSEVDKAIAQGREHLYARMNTKTANWEEVEKPDPKKGGADVRGKQWG